MTATTPISTVTEYDDDKKYEDEENVEMQEEEDDDEGRVGASVVNDDDRNHISNHNGSSNDSRYDELNLQKEQHLARPQPSHSNRAFSLTALRAIEMATYISFRYDCTWNFAAPGRILRVSAASWCLGVAPSLFPCECRPVHRYNRQHWGWKVYDIRVVAALLRASGGADSLGSRSRAHVAVES